MLVHDVSLTLVYLTVWGVIDAINTIDALEYKRPSHEEQKDIARGFQMLKGVGFDNVVGAIDGLVVCCLTSMSCLKFFRDLKCGQINVRCHRKDK